MMHPHLEYAATEALGITQIASLGSLNPPDDLDLGLHILEPLEPADELRRLPYLIYL